MNLALHRSVFVALALASAITSASVARAQSESSIFAPESATSGGSITPKVPVSELARPASWLDVSRLHISTSITMGSGWGGGTEGLQVTSLSYSLAKPLWMSVSLGNAWGANAARNGNSMFLEGLDLGYRPFSNMQIQVHYRDVRSPLQYNYSPYPYRWGE